MSTPYPRIPYGEADIRRIRLRDWLYVDKTRFLRRLEDESYAVLIRPRRFGKSLWVSVLQNYYDRAMAEHWHGVFDGTDIGREPTAERSRYVVLRFDFSAFEDAFATLQERFETHCDIELRAALRVNADLFPEPVVRRITAHRSIDGKLRELFVHCRENGIPLYVMIDEYDNFANTILAHRGTEAYESFTRGGGFYRSFFATLKAGAGTSGGGIERLFITGVSPVTLDDVTSGFNIGANISLKHRFNEMLGFTEAEVRTVLELYRDRGALVQGVEEALDVMREWYNGYRFSEDAERDVYNTNMVLYYLKQSVPNEPMPRDPIDANMRIDYDKLRHLMTVGRAARARLNGNFDLLQQVAGEGEVDADINPSFPLERLADRDNFLSLLHYLGLLSILGGAQGRTRLHIPNQTVRRLMYGHLRDGWRDADLFDADFYAFSKLVVAMAYDGAWRPAVEYLRDAIRRQTGIRDYIRGEKVAQAFVAAHFSMVGHYLIHSERELDKGYADLHLEPFLARYPDIPYGYVIELKYVPRREVAAEAAVAERLSRAKAQLRQYLGGEDLRRRQPTVRYLGLALVFHGWELAAYEAVGQ